MENFGVDGDSVDIKAMLTTWALWDDSNSCNPAPSPAAARSLGETDSSHLQQWATTMPRRPVEAASTTTSLASPQMDVPRLNLQNTNTNDPPTSNHQPSTRSYTSFTKIPSSRKEPIPYGAMGGASSPPLR